MALEIGQLVGIGVQVGLVIGGGNLFRGAALNSAGMDRVTGDPGDAGHSYECTRNERCIGRNKHFIKSNVSYSNEWCC